MDPDEVKKILENAETSVEDKVKLLTGLSEAAARGVSQKNAELLKQEAKLKEQITELEGKVTEAESKGKQLSEELAKASPEEHKKYYDSQLAEQTAKFQNELKAVSEERDKFRESHFARLRDDAIAAGIKDISFVDGLKDGYIALVMMQNNFQPKEIDGKTVFLNETNDTIEAVMHKFSLTDGGKAFIKNQNSGGGAPGVNPGVNGSRSGGQKVDRLQFGAMSPQQQMDFISKGGTVTA
jgi:beta-galactosidase beta subunit